MSFPQPSQRVQILLIGLASCLVVLGAFSLGIHIGERKAAHFSNWMNRKSRGYTDGPGYGRFERDRGAMMGKFRPSFFDQQLPGASGVFGTFVSLNGNELTLLNRDGSQQEILITSSTAIRAGRETVSVDVVKDGSTTSTSISVLGEPNAAGQIEARLIRLAPTKR